MIDIEIYIGRDGVVESIDISGHSSFATGVDIVCAGVSILSQTFYLSLLNIPDIDMEYFDDGKKFFIKLNRIDRLFLSELRALSMFLVIGLEIIAKEFENNINLKVIKGE